MGFCRHPSEGLGVAPYERCNIPSPPMCCFELVTTCCMPLCRLPLTPLALFLIPLMALPRRPPLSTICSLPPVQRALPSPSFPMTLAFSHNFPTPRLRSPIAFFQPFLLPPAPSCPCPPPPHKAPHPGAPRLPQEQRRQLAPSPLDPYRAVGWDQEGWSAARLCVADVTECAGHPLCSPSDQP